MPDILEQLKVLDTDPQVYVVKNLDGSFRRIVVLVSLSGTYGVSLRDDHKFDMLARSNDPDSALNLACQKLKELHPEVQELAHEPYHDPRPNWDQYFMDITLHVSKRSTCPRKAVGALIVRNHRILSTGYNGAIPGLAHCIEVGCDLIKLADGTSNCHRIVHAELNAILCAAQHGVCIAGSDIYTNTYPCWNCFKAIASAKIHRIFFADDYRNDPRVIAAAKEANISFYKV